MTILKKGPNGEFCERHVRQCHSYYSTAPSAARTTTSAGTCAPTIVNTTLHVQSTTDNYCFDDTAAQPSCKLKPSSSYAGKNGCWVWKPQDPCEINYPAPEKAPALTRSYSQYSNTNYCNTAPDPCAETQAPVRQRCRRVRCRQWQCSNVEVQCELQPKKEQNKKHGDACTDEVDTIACDLLENGKQHWNRPNRQHPRVTVYNSAGRGTLHDCCITPGSAAWPSKESETPLYEVRFHKKYNRRSCAFEISYVTKTIHPAYAAYFSSGPGCHTQEDQTGASISATETAQLVWKSFKRVVNTLGWDIVVQIPTTCTKTVQQRQLHHGWAGGHSASGALARFNSAASVLQPSDTNAGVFTVEVPALKEPYVANKHTLGTNIGWYPDVHNHANGGGSNTFLDGFGNICVESNYKQPADNSYDTAVQVVRAWQHYAYEWSGGQLVIGGLEAEVDRRCMRITVTAPVVLSRTGAYGCEDLGSKGLRNWFFWHRTNRFCKPGWGQPRHPRKYYEPKPHNIVQCGGRV